MTIQEGEGVPSRATPRAYDSPSYWARAQAAGTHRLERLPGPHAESATRCFRRRCSSSCQRRFASSPARPVLALPRVQRGHAYPPLRGGPSHDNLTHRFCYAAAVRKSGAGVERRKEGVYCGWWGIRRRRSWAACPFARTDKMNVMPPHLPSSATRRKTRSVSARRQAGRVLES
jgi:hypothetical protein